MNFMAGFAFSWARFRLSHDFCGGGYVHAVSCNFYTFATFLRFNVSIFKKNVYQNSVKNFEKHLKPSQKRIYIGHMQISVLW